MPTTRTHDEIDFAGVLQIEEMAVLFRVSDDSIRRRVKAGTFPIPTLDGVAKRCLWWGPTVKDWLDSHRHSRQHPAATTTTTPADERPADEHAAER